MSLIRPWQSVVTRVIGTLLIGGLVVSAGLSVLEWQRREAALRLNLAQDTAVNVRRSQSALRGLHLGYERGVVETVLQALVSDDHHVLAARVSDGRGVGVVAGDWALAQGRDVVNTRISEAGFGPGQGIALHRLTVVEAPFKQRGRVVILSTLVDGPEAAGAMRHRLFTSLGAMWLLLTVMALLSLFVLRRWFTGPLGRVTELIASGAGPEPFKRFGRQHVGEFRQLGKAIGGMLERIAKTSQLLEERERAFAGLYEQAPTAMLSLDAEARVIEANRRAVELLAARTPEALIGRDGLSFAVPEDRPLLEQTIERLSFQDAASCELRIVVGGRHIDCNVEAAADRDEDGVLRSYRLSLMDVTRSKSLQRELEQQTRLLNMVIDHMSDAILLVGSDGRVAAYNQQLSNLLRRHNESLIGTHFDNADFWDELGVLNKERFVSRLRQIEADPERPAQERFETRSGVFLFQGIPVHDTAGGAIGRLWVVQEVTPQEHSQRLINQQNRQLQVLKDVSASLHGVQGVENLLFRAAEQLFQSMEVSAIGFALRDSAGGRRCRQLIHRGTGAYLLDANRRLAQSIEHDLMPRVLGSKDVALWTDLSAKTDWAQAARGAGLTCMAAVRLRGTADAQGILWIAQRGGERLDRHHIVMIESLAPLLAARIQIAQLTQNMQRADLTDHVTGLPSREQLDHLLSQCSRRPGEPCAVLVIHLDHAGHRNLPRGQGSVDRVLKEVGDAVLAACRRTTFVARETGPAFGIVVPGADTRQATQLAERLSGVIARRTTDSPPGNGRPMTASIGVGACPADGPHAFDARDAALIRMDAARQQGGGRVVWQGHDLSSRAAG